MQKLLRQQTSGVGPFSDLHAFIIIISLCFYSFMLGGGYSPSLSMPKQSWNEDY